MKKAYRTLALLVALGVVVQAASIAYAVFALGKNLDDGGTITKDSDVGGAGFIIHAITGQIVIPLLAIALLIVAFRAKIPEGKKWAGYLLLAIVVQVVLAFVSFAAPLVGVLHGLNALIVFGLAVMAAMKAARSPLAADDAARATA